MPVLITGATGLVGRALALRLRAERAQVRAYIRTDDPELRAAGVHVAIGAIDDVARLESALTRVHTLVHLVGGFRAARGETLDHLNRETAECAAIAARAAEVRRILFLSFPGADPASRDAFLAAKGAAERHVVESGCEYGIFHCPPIVEAATPRRVPPHGGRIPLARVVEALVAADERHAFTSGIWTLEG